MTPGGRGCRLYGTLSHGCLRSPSAIGAQVFRVLPLNTDDADDVTPDGEVPTSPTFYVERAAEEPAICSRPSWTALYRRVSNAEGKLIGVAFNRSSTLFQGHRLPSVPDRLRFAQFFFPNPAIAKNRLPSEGQLKTAN